MRGFRARGNISRPAGIPRHKLGTGALWHAPVRELGDGCQLDFGGVEPDVVAADDEVEPDGAMVVLDDDVAGALELDGVVVVELVVVLEELSVLGVVVVVVDEEDAGGVGGTTTVVEDELGGVVDVVDDGGVCCWQAPSASSTLAATAE